MLRFVFTKTARIPGFEVEHYQALRKLHLIRLNFRYRGVGRTILGLLGYLFKKLGLSYLQEYLFNPAAEPANGLETGGVHEQKDLDIPEDQRGSATRYEASSTYEFRYVLEGLNLNFADYRFIDYGSGKGAVLAAAARYPFDAVIGIELSQQLHEVASRNIDRLYEKKEVRANSLVSLNEDACKHRLAAVPHVFYLYNPFGPDILQQVIARIREDLKSVRKPSFLLYNNPMHRDIIAASGLFTKIAEPMGGAWNLYRMKGDMD